MKQDTTIVTAGRDPESNLGVVNPPVYHTSTILNPSMATMKANGARREKGETVTMYGRIGHPTSLAFEEAMAQVEGGYSAFAFPSGLAAIAAALTSYVAAGDHILVSDSAYRPTRSYCDGVLKRFGVETTYYDPLIGAGIADLIRPNTKIVYVEAPGSHTFEMQDIPAIAAEAKKAGAMVLMDNTWASPLFFRPFEHGVDVSIHAATKYIVGHSDAMLGVVVTNEAAWQPLRQTAQAMGQCVGPDDVYLGLRGLRTLAVRLRQHMVNALDVAAWLETRPEVDRVLHPGLPSHPGHAIWKRDFLGSSGLFSIILRDGYSDDDLARMIDGLKLFGLGASWGGYESLVIHQKPEQFRTATPWSGPGLLVRLHIGLEDTDDLKADLQAGLERLAG
ncbi:MULTISPECIES: cystathionine beta-lyase [unclassified Minwuia]|jgi:cysteine-S-conjugate beta-lyase|uniref:cystathionine beta-lyase n=1 Tax=unclassified Minwuia TaxID=2618799 RepID=UPI00247A5C22|nr:MULTISPECIES: cystathionine beta-lyase [unclassified Minwuia]